MDVRCDRCETEYELDDAIVTDAGASVQCTTCGHTFTVTRRTSPSVSSRGATAPGGHAADPEVPEWTLSTDDGKVHRFRDLNILQKWIVERKVGRSERISRFGGPWLALDDVVDLVPFFNVVDEADRARADLGGPRAPASASGPTSPMSGASSSPSSSSPNLVSPQLPPNSPAPPGSATTPWEAPTPIVVTPGTAVRSGAGGASGATPPSSAIASSTEGRRPLSDDGPTVPNRLLPGSIPMPPVVSSVPLPGVRRTDAPARASRSPSSPIRTITPRATSTGASPARDAATANQASAPSSVGPGAAAAGSPSRTPLHTEVLSPPAIRATMHTLETEFAKAHHRGRNIAIASLLLLAAAGGAGAWWWTDQQRGKAGSSSSGSASSVSDPSSGASANPTSQGASPPPVAAGESPAGGPPNSAAAEPSANPSRAPGELAGGKTGGSAGAIPAAPPGNIGAKPSGASAVQMRGAGAAGVRGQVAGRAGTGTPTARATADFTPGRNVSYDRLVTEGDRLLDRGKSAKADKLYAQALQMRPDGVAALTGSGYVLLDRQRHFKAIETFRRALSIQPTFAPALFGIAESYRARGDTAQALGAYRQYLAVAPSGADAPAARRQIKDLEAPSAGAHANDRAPSEVRMAPEARGQTEPSPVDQERQ